MEFNRTPIPELLPEGIFFISPDTIVLSESGIYEITYYLLPCSEDSTFALFLGNNELPGARYTSTDSSSTLYG